MKIREKVKMYANKKSRTGMRNIYTKNEQNIYTKNEQDNMLLDDIPSEETCNLD